MNETPTDTLVTRELLDLAHWPEKILSQTAQQVTEFNSELAGTIDNMIFTMNEYHGVGLAGPQVNIPKAILVYRAEDEEGENKGIIEHMVNPRITKEEGNLAIQEGCLSFPGVSVDVPRAHKVTVEYQDKTGTAKTVELQGFLSIVVQHEIDHLNGKTFLDRVSKLKRDMIKAKMTKQIKARQRALKQMAVAK